MPARCLCRVLVAIIVFVVVVCPQSTALVGPGHLAGLAGGRRSCWSLKPWSFSCSGGHVNNCQKVIWCNRCLMHSHFSRITEINQQVLHLVHDAVRHKGLKLWTTGNCKLSHDHISRHSAHLVQIFLTKHSIPQICQAPYSPDMAPCDFWLFRRKKKLLK